MNFNYKKYKIAAIFKFIFVALLALGSFAMIVLDLLKIGTPGVSRIAPFTRTIICAIALGYFAIKSFIYLRVACSESYAYDYFLNKHDERNKFIAQKVFTRFTVITLLVELAGTILASYYSIDVLMVLLGLIFIQAFTLFVSYLHYSRKN